MEQKNMNQANNSMPPQGENPMPQMPSSENGEEKSFGPIIGIIIIVIILIFGGLYFWGQELNEVSPEELAPEVDEVIGTLESQGTSDEVADIEADLNATNLGNLDADLEEIEGELGL